MNATATVGETVRLDAWRRVFEKTDRIISGRPVTVKIVQPPEVPFGMEQTPGWSDGVAVHFNGPLVAKMLKTNDTLGAVLRLKGLNYHELSHVLYTPRMSDELPKRVVQRAQESRDNTWWYAFNALEDQRIETWFTASYGTSRRYFEASILQWLITDGNAEAAILVYGRKYLPARLRVQAGRVFVKKHGQDLYDKFKSVIDAYLNILLPQDTVKALKLVAEYHNLLKSLVVNPPPLPVEDNGITAGLPTKGDPGVTRVGRVLKADAQSGREAAQDAMAEAAEADKQAEAELDAKEQADREAAQQSGGQQAGQGADGQGQAQARGASQGDGQGSNVPEGQDTVDANGGTGAGNDAAEHFVLDNADQATAQEALGKAMRDLIDQAHDAMDDVREDETVQADVDKVLDAVKAVANDGEIDVNGPLARGRTTMPADERHQVAVRKVVNILRTIRQEAEPQVIRRQVNGRVDARRVLTRRPNEVDIFTLYDEGAEEETGIEAVILLDVSGSMSYRAAETSAAAWALKRAFDKLEIKTTVLVFDTSHQVLWQPRDKAQTAIPIVSTGGGTDPTSALVEAHLVLSKSNQPNKVLITLTDGQWNGNAVTLKKIMRSLHGQGVHSLLLTIDNASYYGSHGYQTAHELENVSDLPKAALKLVAAILRSATERV